MTSSGLLRGVVVAPDARIERIQNLHDTKTEKSGQLRSYFSGWACGTVFVFRNGRLIATDRGGKCRLRQSLPLPCVFQDIAHVA